MKVTVKPVGELQCNCYLIEKNKDALLIDPGSDIDTILSLIKNKKIKGILITHNHFDHIGCVETLVKKYNYKVYDYNNLDEGIKNIGPFSFEVIYTKGHTMDSITYYFYKEKIMFTGDFLFYDTIGRYDFEESNPTEMKKSIEKIKQYDKDIIIYPGHGRNTTLERELLYNPYL